MIPALTSYDTLSVSLRTCQYFFNKFLGVYTASLPMLGSAAKRGVTHHLMSCILHLFMHMIFFPIEV